MPEPAKNPSPEEEYRKKLISDIRPIARKEAEENPPDVNVEPEEDEEIEGEEEEEQEPQPNREDIERLTRQQRVEKTPQEQLEKGEVPEYEAQPPEAYKQPPGGPAIEPAESRLTDKEIRDKELGSSEIDPKTGQPKRKYTGISKDLKAAHNRYLDLKEKFNLNALKERLKEQAKKLAWEAIKKAAAAAWKSIVAATAEYWGPILIGLIAVIIIIVGVVILIRALQTPNAMGSSPVQAVDILNDYQLIKTVLSLSDSTSFQNMLANNKDQLMTEITNFEETIKAKFPGDPRIPTTISKLDQAKAKISTYSTVDATKADEIKKLIVDAVKPWAADLSPDMLILPLGRGYSAKNITSGGCYLCDRGSYIHRGIDISVPIGRPYYAAATGKIVYLKDDIPDGDKNEDLYHNGRGRKQNGGFGNAIVVEITEGPWVDYYWELHHLKQGSATALSLSKGSMVQQGQTIGQTGHNGMSTGPHMHFQVDKGLICKAWITLGRPCGNTSGTIDPNIALGWKPCPKGLPCNP